MDPGFGYPGRSLTGLQIMSSPSSAALLIFYCLLQAMPGIEMIEAAGTIGIGGGTGTGTGAGRGMEEESVRETGMEIVTGGRTIRGNARGLDRGPGASDHLDELPADQRVPIRGRGRTARPSSTSCRQVLVHSICILLPCPHHYLHPTCLSGMTPETAAALAPSLIAAAAVPAVAALLPAMGLPGPPPMAGARPPHASIRYQQNSLYFGGFHLAYWFRLDFSMNIGRATGHLLQDDSSHMAPLPS